MGKELAKRKEVERKRELNKRKDDRNTVALMEALSKEKKKVAVLKEELEGRDKIICENEDGMNEMMRELRQGLVEAKDDARGMEKRVQALEEELRKEREKNKELQEYCNRMKTGWQILKGEFLRKDKEMFATPSPSSQTLEGEEEQVVTLTDDDVIWVGDEILEDTANPSPPPPQSLEGEEEQVVTLTDDDVIWVGDEIRVKTEDIDGDDMGGGEEEKPLVGGTPTVAKRSSGRKRTYDDHESGSDSDDNGIIRWSAPLKPPSSTIHIID